MENFAENLMDLIKAHWEWVFIVLGLLLLLGGIFNWRWTTDTRSSRNRFIPSGSGCARISVGATGALLIAGGIIALLFF